MRAPAAPEPGGPFLSVGGPSAPMAGGPHPTPLAEGGVAEERFLCEEVQELEGFRV